MHTAADIGVCDYDYMNGTECLYVIMAQRAREYAERSQIFRKLDYCVDIIPAVNLLMPEIVLDKKRAKKYLRSL